MIYYILYHIYLVYDIMHAYIYVHHRTLRGLQNDQLPTLQPGTRSRISAR